MTSTIAESLNSRGYVIVARSMGAARLLDYRVSILRGVVLERWRGRAIVIVARAAGRPVVGRPRASSPWRKQRCSHCRRRQASCTCARSDLKRLMRGSFRAVRPTLSRCGTSHPSGDGVDISLLMNAGLLVDLRSFRRPARQVSACSEPSFSSWWLPPSPSRTAGTSIALSSKRRAIASDFHAGYRWRQRFFPISSSSCRKKIRRSAGAPSADAIVGPAAYPNGALLKAAAGGRELKILLPMITEVSRESHARLSIVKSATCRVLPTSCRCA